MPIIISVLAPLFVSCDLFCYHFHVSEPKFKTLDMFDSHMHDICNLHEYQNINKPGMPLNQVGRQCQLFCSYN